VSAPTVPPARPGLDPPTLDPAVLALLGSVSTPTLQNQLFARGLRNTYLPGVTPLPATDGRFVGEAFTLRYIPAREDLDVLAAFRDPEHPQRAAIEHVQPGQVLVVDSRGDGRCASAGEILLTRLKVRGGVAFVTDGSVRDSPRIPSIGLPVHTAGISAATNLGLHHAVDFDVPIGCAGVPVYPGDVVVGDEEGVVVIPRHLAAEIAQPAVDQDALEVFLRRKVADGAPLPGTYPPSAEVRAEWEARRASSPSASSPAPPEEG
jgi:regulator of RNase E activity RraA